MLLYCLVQVARESALSFVPDADITAIHGSVTTSEYGVGFYKQVKTDFFLIKMFPYMLYKVVILLGA